MQFIWILCFVAVIFACVADVFCTLFRKLFIKIAAFVGYDNAHRSPFSKFLNTPVLEVSFFVLSAGGC